MNHGNEEFLKLGKKLQELERDLQRGNSSKKILEEIKLIRESMRKALEKAA